MTNKHIEYNSTERTPVVLPEMEHLLPPLSPEEYAALESDIVANGCYAPIIVTEDMVIVDGHNRYRICEKHSLPFRMTVFAFDDLLEAKQWALNTQKGRRNLSKWELGNIALRLRPEIEARAKANQGTRTDISVNSPEGLSPVDTRKELASAVGIGEQTMGRIMQINDHGPSAVKEALDSGELSVNRAYEITRQVQALSEEEKEAAALMSIQEMQYHAAVKALDAELSRREKISRLYCSAFEKVALLVVNAENVRIWTECTRMTPAELDMTVQDCRNLAASFQRIGDIIEKEILPNDWRTNALDDGLVVIDEMNYSS